ncbi:MAG: DNA replication/repair protein RecF [Pseudomonadota bacterium]
MDATVAPHPVWVETLKLNHFRNYATLRLECDRRHVVLTGQNGAGKTNLLEAISFLSPGRGLRRVAYDRVAQQERGEMPYDAQEGTWAVHAILHGAVGEVAVGTGLQKGSGNRRIHVNGTATKTSEELLDHCRVVWLTPAMDGLFTGGTGDRRRFLDRMVLAIDPAHGRRVSAFEWAMRSRNKLLEDHHADASFLTSVEAQMAEQAVAITFARAELLSLLRDMIAHMPDSAFPRSIIGLEKGLEQESEGAASDLEDIYKAELARARPQDRAAGRTLTGPHRSNFTVRHGPKDMEAALCSTGEQKALLTGLVLAHARLVASVSGMTPLLLLDEIAAHLDPDRRAALFDLIDEAGAQAWMTGTDEHLFEAMGERAQFFTVDDGKVTPA